MTAHLLTMCVLDCYCVSSRHGSNVYLTPGDKANSFLNSPSSNSKATFTFPKEHVARRATKQTKQGKRTREFKNGKENGLAAPSLSVKGGGLANGAWLSKRRKSSGAGRKSKEPEVIDLMSQSDSEVDENDVSGDNDDNEEDFLDIDTEEVLDNTASDIDSSDEFELDDDDGDFA